MMILAISRFLGFQNVLYGLLIYYTSIVGLCISVLMMWTGYTVDQGTHANDPAEHTWHWMTHAHRPQTRGFEEEESLKWLCVLQWIKWTTKSWRGKSDLSGVLTVSHDSHTQLWHSHRPLVLFSPVLPQGCSFSTLPLLSIRVFACTCPSSEIIDFSHLHPVIRTQYKLSSCYCSS